MLRGYMCIPHQHVNTQASTDVDILDLLRVNLYELDA